MKVLCITISRLELDGLVPLLRELYFRGETDGLALVATKAEFDYRANPWITRRLAEYGPAEEESTSAALAELLRMARCAVLQERPKVVILPEGSQLAAPLSATLAQADVGLILSAPGRSAAVEEVLLKIKSSPCAISAEPIEGVAARAVMAEYWERLDAMLAKDRGPCLLLGEESAVRECQDRFPQRQFHPQPRQNRYSQAVSLLALASGEAPEKTLSFLRARCDEALLLEPVNAPISGGVATLCYGDYDNEFAFHPATVDLKSVLSLDDSIEIWHHRSGQAGDRPLPSPDGRHPLFAARLNTATPHWSQPYRLPRGESLKIIFADSGNVAGSVLHHTKAINEFTDSQAWALTLAPHPLIGSQTSNEHTFFLSESGGRPTQAQEEVLRQADLFVFFEDDDEDSDNWPFPLREFVADKTVLHLYIGYRVHRRSHRLQRQGRRILTPLPHLLKMYPQAHFYAGFPPQETLELPLTSPRSAQDGVCRILHTPSVPHWTTARYPYHKDTEAFFRAGRLLKKRFQDKVEFHQIGGWSHNEIMAARQLCDITFNQLRGFLGLSGDEAMLLERPCVQAFDRSNINRHREYWGLQVEFPWVTASHENLPEVLAELIEDPEGRAELGRRSRAFMLKYFSPQEGILPLLFHCYQAVKGGAIRSS